MLIGDANGILPSNTGAGYILRRLLRRAIRYCKNLCIAATEMCEVAKVFIEKVYFEAYPLLVEKEANILDEITKDIQTMVDAVFNATKGPRGSGTVTPDTLKLPREAYTSLTTRTKGVDSDVTFLKALQDRFAPQGIKAIECCNSAAGVGNVGGTPADRALLYKKAPENVFSILPVVFQVLPAQYVGLSIIYNCVARTGGTAWRRPTTGVYMDGI